MKKIYTLTIAVFVLLSANAQLFNIGGVGIGYFYAGPKLGGNASFNTVEVGSGTDKKANFGSQFGAVAKLGITDKLSIQPELIYTSKGYTTNNNTFGDVTAHSNYKYFGLPVIVKYAFLAVNGVQIYGSGGFYTDYMTSARYIVKFDGTVEEDIKETDLSVYKRVDFGFTVGGGTNIDLKNNDKLNIDLRFALGTTDVDDSGITSSSKNMSLQLSAIYLFDMTRWISFGGAKKTQNNDAYEENSTPAGGSKVE